MPFIGPIIKQAISIKHLISSSDLDAANAQEEQLENLLRKAASTAFGKYYGFKKILQAADKPAQFQKQVPIHHYDDIGKSWWAQQQKYPDITWPGRPSYFALSSGTTGKESKRIPVTEDMLASFRQVGLSQVEHLANFDLPADFFEKDILLLSSSTNLEQHKDHLEGEISGINSSNIPSWFERFYKPGMTIAQMDDWEERVSYIAKEAPNWDVGAIAGIPPWVKMMLERIIEEHQLNNIHELWPDLQLYASGGVAFAPYRDAFNELMEHPIHYTDTYLASEGFFAFTGRPDTMNMQLALNHGLFYEFIPFDGSSFDEMGNLKEEPVCLGIGQVEADKEYALLVSTPAGAWRYMIGDLIKFVDIDRYEIVLSGRTKYFLNVAGSQLSEEKINNGIEQLAKKLGVSINEYAVAAIQNGNGEIYHQWVLGSKQSIDEEKAVNILDETLKELNKNYGVARTKALKDVKLKVVDTDRIYNWLEKTKKKGGQIKMPKVMKEEKMKDLLSFIQ
jgi:hypothetical protein